MKNINILLQILNIYLYCHDMGIILILYDNNVLEVYLLLNTY